ncbi:hypothetical protein ACF0H5_017976 [Mactra antiquata]
MSAVKENKKPAEERRSKLPVPTMFFSSVKKGRKRAVSPSASSSDAKRSPISTNQSKNKSSMKGTSKSEVKRHVLGELPREERKIMKVRRGLNVGTNNVNSTSKTQISKTKCNLSNSSKKKVSFNDDQSDILFEKDDNALQSILDETGIQYGQRSTGPNFTRHTLAAAPKPQRISRDPTEVKKVGVEELCRAFDDFIDRNTKKEPPNKRQCRETIAGTKEERFTLKLTPSKTDFCARFGVEGTTTFTGATPRSGARQSLPGRTKLQQLDPFALPPRTSIFSQTPRLARVDENSGRVSLTPRRVPKTETTIKNEASPGLLSTPQSNDVLATPDRFSMYESSTRRSTLSIQTTGRMSLIQGKRAQQFSVPTPGRVSLSAQRCQTRSGQIYEENEHRTSVIKPGRVSISKTDSSNDLFSKRESTIGATPGRVKCENHSNVLVENQSTDIRMNLKEAFSSMEEKDSGKVGREKELKQSSVENKTETSKNTKSWHDILTEGMDDHLISIC